LPDDVAPDAVEAIRRQAALVVSTCERTRLPLHDVERVRTTFDRNFGRRGSKAIGLSPDAVSPEAGSSRR
jgi:hypothetical protein